MPSGDLEYTPVTGGPSDRSGAILLREFLSDFRKGYDRWGPNKVILPTAYRPLRKPIADLAVKDDDIFVISHPKTGTTWTQEMVWLLGSDLDYEGAKTVLPARFPFLEHTSLFDYTDILPRQPSLKPPRFVTDSVGFVDDLEGRRFIKTHLPWELLPTQLQDGSTKAKIVYVVRNPKDTCLSYFYHCRLLEGYKGNFAEFCELFLDNALTFQPFWPHAINFWERKDKPHILFITYEELKKDLADVIKRVAAFLGRPPLTEEQLRKLTHHLSFESMKNNPATNYEEVVNINRQNNLIQEEGCFMRSGKVGDYKEKMTSEMIERFDNWSQSYIAGTDFPLI